MLIGYPGSKLLQVHEYFQSLGLDIWDAWTFFRLLDADGGGEAGVSQSQLLRNLDQIVSRDIVYIHIHIYIYIQLYTNALTRVSLLFVSEVSVIMSMFYMRMAVLAYRVGVVGR